ncbi:MAG: protein-L-isoaspartate(D-aspartate) O-methyltransferase [bacterium]|nr:protein-L-isoaspartate(D-aspartate) O-methyltransferase [bacterium]
MTKEDLIQALIKDGYLKTPAIIEAFQKIDRKDFVPEEHKERAYVNEALPIGYGQTTSQPLVVAFMLELLQLNPGEKVLEIGTGSGWKTALLAQLGGIVFSMERIEELQKMADKNIQNYGFIENGSVKLLSGDGSKGYPEGASFDKIIAAAAADVLPEAWKGQLNIGGRMVAPVGESILVLEKISKNKFKTKEYFGFSFVPLIRS